MKIDGSYVARVGVLGFAVATLSACGHRSTPAARPSVHPSNVGSSPAAASPPGSSPPEWSFRCTPGAPEGCSAPHPIKDDLVGQLSVDASGRRIIGRFKCGGALTAQITGTRIALTFQQQIMKPGAMACAMEVVSVTLGSAVDGRTVVDAVTGAVVPITPQPAAASSP